MGTLFRYLGYMAAKWVCFYLYQYFESGNSWKWERVETKEDVYYTAWMLLVLPAAEMFLLALPIHLAIRQKGWIMLVALALTFALEFAIGWYATNQQLSTWMIVKIFLSVGLFWLFYRKQLEF
jgi:NADH:ubiquinone oxidoreductase subunit 3 (subunit A)